MSLSFDTFRGIIDKMVNSFATHLHSAISILRKRKFLFWILLFYDHGLWHLSAYLLLLCFKKIWVKGNKRQSKDKKIRFFLSKIVLNVPIM